MPIINATASKDKEGKIHISLSNVDLKKTQEVIINLPNLKGKKVSGEILTASRVSSYNSFDKPNEVVVKPFDGAKIKNNQLVVKMPAHSIVTLEI